MVLQVSLPLEPVEPGLLEDRAGDNEDEQGDPEPLNLDLFEAMDIAGKAHKLVRRDPTALPAREIVRMATILGARALGLGERVGSLEAGKQADLVLIDARVPELTPLYDPYAHLVYAVKGANVRTVIVGGRVVVHDRAVLTVDAAEAMARCNAIQKRILKVLGR